MAISSIREKNQYSSLFGIARKKNDIQQKQGMSMRRLEHEQRTQNSSNSIVGQSISYADQLRAERNKAKKTSNEKKKLQYNFKKISSQIIRSKKSTTAKSAVQCAKREVRRLERLKGNEDYDETEVQLALDHAKSMEKVAKKKVLHLEQEEMIERNGKGLAVDIDEVREEKDGEDDKKNEELTSEGADEELTAEEELSEEDMTSELIFGNMMSELSEDYYSEIEEITEETFQELEDVLSETMDELMESTAAPDPNMSAENLKKLKIKHRSKELKEIAEADKEYLKGLMEHEKAKQAGANAVPAGSSVSMPASSDRSAPVINIPPVYGGGGGVSSASGGGINICI